MDTSKIISVDIEANGLLDEVSVIHCINTRLFGHPSKSWYDVTSGSFDTVSQGCIKTCIQCLVALDNKGYQIVFHNGEGYDLPALKKLYPDEPLPNIIDTLALSRILFPERGSHSLDSWGEELGIPKVVHDDWSKLSQDMLVRCDGDTKILELLMDYLGKHPDLPYDLYESGGLWYPLRSEQEIMRIHEAQCAKGVRFDILGASALYAELTHKKMKLEDRIVTMAPWSCNVPNVAKMNQGLWRNNQVNKIALLVNPADSGVKPFKKNGDWTVNTINYFKEDDAFKKVLGPYSKVSLTPMNLNSSSEVKGFLLSLGWKPTEWNYTFTSEHGKQKTSPKLTEESYSSLPPGLGTDIAEYNVLKHRCNFLFNPMTGARKEDKGALAVVANKRGDGRIAADAITCGTPTARYRHRGVICNIPRPGTPYGAEIRSLFCVPDDSWMLGLDLSGIEARMLAHYIMPFKGGKELADVIVNDDYHMYNTKAWFPECIGDEKQMKFHRNSHSKGGLYALRHQRM